MFKYDFRERDVQNIMKELWMFKYNEQGYSNLQDKLGTYKYFSSAGDVRTWTKNKMP